MADQRDRANRIGRFAFIGSIACAVAIGACSSSSSPATSGTDASTDASTADHESSEASTADDAAADVATTPSGPVMCGSLTCTAPAGGIVALTACCLPDNTCGASPNLSSLGGASAAPPAGVDAGSVCLTLESGTPDPSCPSTSVMGVTLGGCCAAGACGYDLSVIGLGCNAFSAFGGGAGAQMACSVGDGAAPPTDAEADAADAQTSATTDAQTDSGAPADAQADAMDAQSPPTDAQADGASVTDARADAADAH